MTEASVPELEAQLAAARAEPASDEALIDAIASLAWALRNTDIPRANALGKEARDRAVEAEYVLGQARATRVLAMTLVDPHEVKQVLQLAEEALALFDRAQDPTGRAGARDFLASLYEYTGDQGRALELAFEALSIAREQGDPIRQGYALSNIGGVLAATGDVDGGVARLEEALALFEGARELPGAGRIYGRLADILAEADRDEEALSYAQRCIETGEALDSHYLVSEGLQVQADIAAKQDDFASAERLYRAAVDSLPAGPAREVLGGEVHVALGRMLLRRGEDRRAEVELERARGLIQEYNISTSLQASVDEALSALRERQGRFKEALDHLKSAKVLRDELAQRDLQNKVAQVEARAAMAQAQRDAETHKHRYAELHRMQSKLLEAEKMALLGRLAAGTAHELNTPLGVLRSNLALVGRATQRLLAELPADQAPRAGKLMSSIETCRTTSDQALERIASIAESFRRFTQLDQAQMRKFDLREGLQSAVSLLAPTLPPDIEVIPRLTDVPDIVGWPRELNHAFMTVLQNAAQAIDGPGTITIETERSDAHLVARVRDTGRGMDAEQVAHLFDVGWSEGSRTSMRLGLSAAYATMQKHGGTIDVQSARGRGTTVAFLFPIPVSDE